MSEPPLPSATSDSDERERLRAEIERLEVRVDELQRELTLARTSESAPSHHDDSRRRVRHTKQPSEAKPDGSPRTAELSWAPRRAKLVDGIVLGLLLVAGAILRFVDLTSKPWGIHGDEATTGLLAREIMDRGWVGPYTGLAGGNPTGAYYLAAIPVHLIDDPVLGLRVPVAIIATLAIPALYVLVRRNAGFAPAVLASTLLCFSSWHLAFSRIGFVTGMWPTFLLLGVFALLEAKRTNHWGWWAGAGALSVSGVYIYNGHVPVLPVLIGLGIWLLFGWRGPLLLAALGCLSAGSLLLMGIAVALTVAVTVAAGRPAWSRTTWLNAAAFIGASLVTLWPLAAWVRAHPDDYFGRGRDLSLFRTPEWTTANIADKATLVLDRYLLFWDRLTFHSMPNGVDPTGVTPIVPVLTLALFLAGSVALLTRAPSPLVRISAVIVLLAPLSAVFTDMTIRRALGIAPFIAIITGIGLVEISRRAWQRNRRFGRVVAGVIVALVLISAWQNTTDFFQRTVDSISVRGTFSIGVRDTAEYLATLPPDAYIVMYDERTVLEFETYRLLAPGLTGENRMPVWGGNGSLEVDRTKGRPVLVFAGGLTDLIAAAEQRYPDGTVVTGRIEGAPYDGPTFVAIELP